MILVDEPGPDCMGGEGGTTHRKIVRRSFQEIQLNAHVAGQNPLAAANHDSTSPELRLIWPGASSMSNR